VRYVVGRSGKDKDDVGHDDPLDEDPLFEADDDDDGDSLSDSHQLPAFPKLGLPNNSHLRQDSSFLSAVDLGQVPHSDSGFQREGSQQRRNASTGLALLGNFSGNQNISTSCKSSQGHDPAQVIPPPHRPLVGGGAAAAYEVARADHYMKLAAQKKVLTSFGSGSSGPTLPAMPENRAIHNAVMFGDKTNSSTKKLTALDGTLPPLPFQQQSTSPNLAHAMKTAQPTSEVHQHYELLKIHHMNLLKEVQETTIMMNIYQQQILQEQLKKKQRAVLPARPREAASKTTDSSKILPDGVWMMDSSSSTNHGFAAPTLQGAVESARNNVMPVNRVRPMPPGNDDTLGEDEAPRVKRLHFENLKAEILEKQALLESMAEDMGQNNDSETFRSSNLDDQGKAVVE
jgi:hypothetical protein